MTVFKGQSQYSSYLFHSNLPMTVTSTADHCEYFRSVQSLFAVAVMSSTLLFVIRSCALYNKNKFVVSFFTLSWLVVCGLNIALLINSEAIHADNAKLCIRIVSKSQLFVVITYQFVHDTLVFLATSWAFLPISYGDIDITNGLKVLVTGRYLPAFSRSILHNGQAYYLWSLFGIVNVNSF